MSMQPDFFFLASHSSISVREALTSSLDREKALLLLVKQGLVIS
jgi:hypothetical protein